MRTTITLSAEVHHQVASIARDRRATLSSTVEDLLRQVLTRADEPAPARRSERTGLPVVALGRSISVEDVRALDDE